MEPAGVEARTEPEAEATPEPSPGDLPASDSDSAGDEEKTLDEVTELHLRDSFWNS